MLGGLLWNRISFSVLLLLIQTGCLYEYLMLVRKFQVYTNMKRRIALVVTMICVSAALAYVVILQQDFLSVINALWIFPICLLLLAAELFYQSETPFINGLVNVGAAIYIGIPVICLYSLADSNFDAEEWFPKNVAVPLGIVLLIWANDTFAYFTGSLLGKHKILPAISPKKSWEGFFGGLIFALITGWILSRYFSKLNLQQWMIVALIVVVFGTIGDFFESMIKRQAGVKDTGNLLPGHGGFLDRFDALIFCVPFVAMYLLLSK